MVSVYWPSGGNSVGVVVFCCVVVVSGVGVGMSSSLSDCSPLSLFSFVSLHLVVFSSFCSSFPTSVFGFARQLNPCLGALYLVHCMVSSVCALTMILSIGAPIALVASSRTRRARIPSWVPRRVRASVVWLGYIHSFPASFVCFPSCWRNRDQVTWSSLVFRLLLPSAFALSVPSLVACFMSVVNCVPNLSSGGKVLRRTVAFVLCILVL
jgi:hypothetical protein